MSSSRSGVRVDERLGMLVVDATSTAGQRASVALDRDEAAQLLRDLAHAGAMPSETLRDLADTVAEREAYSKMLPAVAAFPTAAEGVDRPEMAMPQPAVKPAAPAPARTLRRKP